PVVIYRCPIVIFQASVIIDAIVIFQASVIIVAIVIFQASVIIDAIVIFQASVIIVAIVIFQASASVIIDAIVIFQASVIIVAIVIFQPVPVSLWVLLLSTNTVMKLMVSCVFSGTSLLINNSVEPELAGQVNGLSMTITAIFRSLAPLVGGILYSWTVGYSSDAIGPPFDVSFVFMLFGPVYWIVAIIGVTIPSRLNRQKK
ncbi:uncharacterized protein LOC132735994, partial [Ruditapes philippinarum]|uniref:uncharacterized protein LOC132735994 n=1 Tax=Ruditapes philippinarum TaxID=129788 RepID=UPI00295AE21B